ncbi:MAG: RNase P modulator RnpM [Acutalibacteraceae bacterium]
MNKPRKLPQRLCTGCGEMKPKRELVRVVKSKDGDIALDLTGRANGRGAYVCRSLSCLQAARRSKRFEKAFSCRIPDEIYDQMEEAMKADEHAE